MCSFHLIFCVCSCELGETVIFPVLCPMSESPSGKREGLQDNATGKMGKFITDSSQGPMCSWSCGLVQKCFQCRFHVLAGLGRPVGDGAGVGRFQGMLGWAEASLARCLELKWTPTMALLGWVGVVMLLGWLELELAQAQGWAGAALAGQLEWQLFKPLPLCWDSERVSLCTSSLRGSLGFLQFSGFPRCPSHGLSNPAVGLPKAGPRAVLPSVELELTPQGGPPSL